MNMKKAVIYGSTNTGKRIYDSIKDEVNVIAYLDEDSEKWGGDNSGIKIYPPEELLNLDYDYIYVGVLTFYEEVMKRLNEMHIPEYKIVDKYVSLPTKARIAFLENACEVLKAGGVNEGNVAELGVYKGNFAKEINRVFPDRKLYLFDTFGGFDEKDDRIEQASGFSEKDQVGYFSDTSPEYVLGRMPYRDKCIVRPGFFPDTAQGLEDERFAFVNIDADLYAPILAGLKWFVPRMVTGGIVLVHDYYSTAFTGAREAVDEYANEYGLRFVPIGDTLSVCARV
ncbi:MAG: methyltransferase [Selenomonas ruminantium]|nr:methyltransferase [Selenomonas ruminantium]